MTWKHEHPFKDLLAEHAEELIDLQRRAAEEEGRRAEMERLLARDAQVPEDFFGGIEGRPAASGPSSPSGDDWGNREQPAPRVPSPPPNKRRRGRRQAEVAAATPPRKSARLLKKAANPPAAAKPRGVTKRGQGTGRRGGRKEATS